MKEWIVHTSVLVMLDMVISVDIGHYRATTFTKIIIFVNKDVAIRYETITGEVNSPQTGFRVKSGY